METKGKVIVMAATVMASRNGVDRIVSERVEKVFVTPEMALEWLARNTCNRRLIKAHVESLAASLARGEWTLNGQTIKFSKDGLLLDGQHRLNACVESDVGFFTYVAYGLERDAFDTIDVNVRTRTAGDILSLHGKENTTRLAACVKMLWAFGLTGQFYQGGGGISGFSAKLCLDIVSRRPGIEGSVSRCARVRVFPSTSLLSALHYLFSCADSAMASDMATIMEDGSSDLERPFNIFREAVISRRLTTRSTGNRQLAFMAIRAWNSEITANWIKKVYYKPNEEFPQIVGLNYERLGDYV
jgi:hypothetical protein